MSHLSLVTSLSLSCYISLCCHISPSLMLHLSFRCHISLSLLFQVQKDLVSSVSHSVLDDRISEAVCVVADTERWSVSLCSSMREQPKPLAASHLVMAMVETVSNLAKLRMSPEFVSQHSLSTPSCRGSE